MLIRDSSIEIQERNLNNVKFELMKEFEDFNEQEILEKIKKEGERQKEEVRLLEKQIEQKEN